MADDQERELFITPSHKTVRLLLAAGDSARRLWLALALRADWWTGEAWPSYETLKKDHGLSSNCVAAGIAELEEIGLLERRRRFSSSTKYFLKGFVRPDGTSLSAQETLSLLESNGNDLHSSLGESNGASIPLSEQLPVLSTREKGSLPPQVQSSLSPEANDSHSTTSSKNDTGGGSAGPPAAPEEAALVRLSEKQGLMALGRRQRESLVHSIVLLAGGTAAASEALKTDGFRGWDLKDVHRAIARAKTRGDPAPRPRKPPDPGCKICGGRGRRLNPITAKDMDCRCVE